jgi:hypothetical protein
MMPRVLPRSINEFRQIHSEASNLGYVNRVEDLQLTSSATTSHKQRLDVAARGIFMHEIILGFTCLRSRSTRNQD